MLRNSQFRHQEIIITVEKNSYYLICFHTFIILIALMASVLSSFFSRDPRHNFSYELPSDENKLNTNDKVKELFFAMVNKKVILNNNRYKAWKFVTINVDKEKMKIIAWLYWKNQIRLMILLHNLGKFCSRKCDLFLDSISARLFEGTISKIENTSAPKYIGLFGFHRSMITWKKFVVWTFFDFREIFRSLDHKILEICIFNPNWVLHSWISMKDQQ